MSCCTAVVVSLARSSYVGYEELDGIEVCVQLQQRVNATVQLTAQSGTASEGVNLHHYIAFSQCIISLSHSLSVLLQMTMTQ